VLFTRERVDELLAQVHVFSRLARGITSLAWRCRQCAR
jgi:hypothetical protein